MSELQFTGTVSIEDANPPPADYTPARKVNVQITFAGSEQEAVQSALDRASVFASAKVEELLDRTPRPTAAVQPAAEKKPAAVRSKKADPAPPASSDTSAASGGTEGSADPFEVAPESPEVLAERARLAADLAAGQVAEADEFTVQPEGAVATNDDFDLTTAPPAEITDAELNAAVTKKNAEINNAPAIRGLIGSYNPDPKKQFQLREIPQAQRQDFLDKLAKLAKAA